MKSTRRSFLALLGIASVATVVRTTQAEEFGKQGVADYFPAAARYNSLTIEGTVTKFDYLVSSKLHFKKRLRFTVRIQFRDLSYLDYPVIAWGELAETLSLEINLGCGILVRGQVIGTMVEDRFFVYCEEYEFITRTDSV